MLAAAAPVAVPKVPELLWAAEPPAAAWLLVLLVV
jgi:hypothetical protein